MWADGSQITPEQVQNVKTSLSAVLKTIISVVGGAGSVIALVRTSLDLLQNRSLVAKRNSELERAGKFADLLGKFSAEKVPKEHQEAIAAAVQGCLQECITNVASLNKRLDALRLDPTSTLSTSEKLLLIFRPASWQGWALHLLTYASSAWCAWYVFHSGVQSEQSSFSVDTFLTQWRSSSMYLGLAFSLVVVGIFRAWAMEERRRSLGYRKPAGRLALWLVIRFPENTRMLLAQVMFFISSMAFLTVIHGSFTDWLDARSFEPWTAALVYGSMLLIIAWIFRNWALAELTSHEHKPQLVRWKTALFTGFFKNWRAYGLLRGMYFLALGPLVFTMFIGGFAFILFSISKGFLMAFLCLFLIPLPSLVFTYALFRSLKIKCSMAAVKETLPAEETAALSVTA